MIFFGPKFSVFFAKHLISIPGIRFGGSWTMVLTSHFTTPPKVKNMGCCCFSEFHDFCLGVRKKEEKCVSVAPIGAPEIRLLRLGTVTKICLPFILFPIFISISLLYMYLY